MIPKLYSFSNSDYLKQNARSSVERKNICDAGKYKREMSLSVVGREFFSTIPIGKYQCYEWDVTKIWYKYKYP